MAKKPSGKKAAGAKAGPKARGAKKAAPRTAKKAAPRAVKVAKKAPPRAARATQADTSGTDIKSIIAGAFLRRGG